MNKNVRNTALLSLLLCGLIPFQSRADITGALKSGVIAATAYTVSENLTKENVKSVLDLTGKGIKAITWDYGIKGVWDKPLPTMSLTSIIAGIKLIYDEVSKPVDDRNNGMIGLGGAGIISGFFFGIAHLDLINKFLNQKKQIN